MLADHKRKLILQTKEQGVVSTSVHPVPDDDSSYLLRAEERFGQIEIFTTQNKEYTIWHSTYMIQEAINLVIGTEEPYLGLHFILQNDFHCHLEGLSSTVLLEHQFNLAYVPRLNSEHFFSAGKYAAFGIQLSQSLLTPWARSFKPLSALLDSVSESKPQQISEFPMAVNPEITSVILSILHCGYTGELKKMYLDIKVPELIFLSLQRTGSDIPKQLLRRDDLKKIQQVRDFLLNHMNNPGTIVDLAHEVGINDFKLKVGFKQVYGTTIFGFLHEERMQQAWLRIIESDTPISVIATEAGYNNLSGFSTAFRRRFGYPPSSLRKGSSGPHNIK